MRAAAVGRILRPARPHPPLTHGHAKPKHSAGASAIRGQCQGWSRSLEVGVRLRGRRRRRAEQERSPLRGSQRIPEEDRAAPSTWPADLRTFAISRRSPLARRQDLAQVDVARPTGLLVYLCTVLLRAHPPPRTFFSSPRPPPTTPRAGSRTRGARRGPGGAHERTVRASRRPKRSGRGPSTIGSPTAERTAKPPGTLCSYPSSSESYVGVWPYTATRPRAGAAKGSELTVNE